MKRRILTQLGAVCACAVAILSGSAFAYFTHAGGGTAAAAVTTLAAPTLGTPAPATGGTVTLTWSAVTAPDSGTVTYYVTRNGGLPAESCPDVNGPETVTTCTDSGLSPGNYEYKVIAVWHTWSKTSAGKSATVAVGPMAKFSITGSTTTPSTGVADNLTITAKDSAGGTVSTFTGSHNLVFSGASPSAEGKAPTVTNASGTPISFGEATALTFTNGVASVSSPKNGVMQIYKPGEASITATEGSFTTPVPLAVNVLPTASRFVLSATTATPTASALDGLTIKAYDAYGNLSTNYTGTKSLVFSGPAASPSGTAATVENSSGSQIAIGSTTTITFKEGVASSTEAGAGAELTIYKSGATTLKAAEGSTVTTPTALSLTVSPGAAVSLTLTSTATSFATTSSANLTTTAKDSWGNVATGYGTSQNLVYTATGTAGETSPGGNVPGVNGNAGTTQLPFGTSTPTTFTAGVATVASSKNGVLRLYKSGSASITVSDGTLTSAPLAFTITTGVAKKIAFNSLTASPGTISNPCYFTCTVSTLGNSGTITSKVAITDEYGNLISAIGSGKTVAIAATGTTGSSVTPTSLTIAESGSAISTASFTFTAPSGTSTFTNTITASLSGYSSATITATK